RSARDVERREDVVCAADGDADRAEPDPRLLPARTDEEARGQRQQDRTRPRHRRSEEHTSELQSRFDLVCRLLLEKKNKPAQRHNSVPHHAPTRTTFHLHANPLTARKNHHDTVSYARTNTTTLKNPNPPPRFTKSN